MKGTDSHIAGNCPHLRNSLSSITHSQEKYIHCILAPAHRTTNKCCLQSDSSGYCMTNMTMHHRLSIQPVCIYYKHLHLHNSQLRIGHSCFQCRRCTPPIHWNTDHIHQHSGSTQPNNQSNWHYHIWHKMQSNHCMPHHSSNSPSCIRCRQTVCTSSIPA